MREALLFIDFEGTGTNPTADRIVEACFHVVGGETFTTRVNPGVPIPAEATAVHGIRDADVADAPTFRQIAPRVQAMVEGVVLCGYSIRKYDTLLLHAELRRAGQPGLACDAGGRISVPELDLYQLWLHCEPRTLAGAVRRFAGIELGERAHSAEADTVHLPEVLAGICEAFGLDPADPAALCALCVPEGEVDRDGKFRRRPDGVVVFNFGQKRGSPVLDDPGLLGWMLRRDFSAETLASARGFLEEAYAAVGDEDRSEGDLFDGGRW